MHGTGKSEHAAVSPRGQLHDLALGVCSSVFVMLTVGLRKALMVARGRAHDIRLLRILACVRLPPNDSPSCKGPTRSLPSLIGDFWHEGRHLLSNTLILCLACDQLVDRQITLMHCKSKVRRRIPDIGLDVEQTTACEDSSKVRDPSWTQPSILSLR